MTSSFFSWLGGEAGSEGRWGYSPRFRSFFAGGNVSGYERSFSRTVDTGWELEVDVENEAGRVRFRGHDEPVVRIEVVAHLIVDSDDAADAQIEAIKAAIQFENNRLSIRTPSFPAPPILRGGWGPHVEYDLVVPRAARLSLRTENGSTDVEGLTGEIKVVCRNGAVRVEGAGKVDVEARNGTISLADVAADARAETSNGSITLARVHGMLAGKTRNGSLRYSGDLPAGIDLESSNGGLRLTLPESSRFQLDAETDLGTIRSEFNVRDSRPELEGEPPVVHLRTRTGEIVLEKLAAGG